MTYGLSTSAFIEGGPAARVAEANARRSTARAWRALDQARRMELVEQMLAAANDHAARWPQAC